MTKEKERRRAQDEHVKYIKENLCDKDSDKSYVFISYRSGEWETVLHDIVYSLVKDYGLNVYFDGSFDSHNSLWVTRFPENMEDYKCKGVLAFLSDEYATSYATLLELMYSQIYRANEGLPVVPVNISHLTKIDGAQGAEDTGLGVEHYEDGKKNLNAKTEKELFDDIFGELTEREILKKSKYLYKKDKKLTRKICSEIVAELVGHLGVNENHYERGNSLDGIVGSIKDACGEDVFSRGRDDGGDQDDTGDPGPNDVGDPVPETGTYEISFRDFLKKYDNRTFKKNTFSRIGLAGKGSCSVYRTKMYDSTYQLVWAFVTTLLKEKGKEYIDFVNEKNAGLKNPPFITAEEHRIRRERGDSVKYRRIDVKDLEGYSMCMHYSQYDWISNVLKKRMQELELPLEQFVFVYKTGEDDPVKEAKERISLTDFLTSYNNRTFQSGFCKSLRLVGTGEYERYSTGGYATARSLVFAFAMKRLDERGMAYITLVNEKNSSKNPIFITADEHRSRKERHESVTYKSVTSDAVQGYSMCTHYSEYDWLKNSLKKQLDALGWPLDSFYLEFEIPKEKSL